MNDQLEGGEEEMTLENMQIKEVKTKRFFAKCKICGHEVSSNSESALEYNMKIHLNAKHSQPLENQEQ